MVLRACGPKECKSCFARNIFALTSATNLALKSERKVFESAELVSLPQKESVRLTVKLDGLLGVDQATSAKNKVGQNNRFLVSRKSWATPMSSQKYLPLQLF